VARDRRVARKDRCEAQRRSDLSNERFSLIRMAMAN
jgi:hypothetical protein